MENKKQRWEDFDSDENDEYAQEQQDDVLEDQEILQEYLKFSEESKGQNAGEYEQNFNRRGGKRGGRGGGGGGRSQKGGDRDNNRPAKNYQQKFDPDQMIRNIKNTQSPYIFQIYNVCYSAKLQDIQNFYSDLQIVEVQQTQKGAFQVELNSMDEAIRLVNKGQFSIQDRQILLKFEKYEQQKQYQEKKIDNYRSKTGFSSSKKVEDRQPIRKQQPYNRRKGSEDDYDDFGLKIIEKEKEIKERKPLVFINRKKDAQETPKAEENEENKSKQNPFGSAKPIVQQPKDNSTKSTEKNEKQIQENPEKNVEQKEIKRFNNRNKQQKVEQKEIATTTTTVSDEKKKPLQKNHINKFDIFEDDE